MANSATASGLVDETDLQLLNLLQIAPRISWSDASEILNISATSLANRWSDLQARGVAWQSVYPDLINAGLLLAFIDVTALPASRSRVETLICADPRIASVQAGSGPADFTLTVIVSDFAALNEVHRMLQADEQGIAGTRVRVVTHMHSEGADWRFDSLSKQQQARAQEVQALAWKDAAGGPVATDSGRLVQILATNPRASVADLARQLDQNPATVRRHLQRLLASGLVRIRLDTAPGVSGWPVEITYLCRLEAGAVANAVRRLRAVPQVKLSVSVLGDAELVFSVVARKLSHAPEIERAIRAAVPELRIHEALVTMHRLKRMGRLLDEREYATDTVTAPLWDLN